MEVQNCWAAVFSSRWERVIFNHNMEPSEAEASPALSMRELSELDSAATLFTGHHLGDRLRKPQRWLIDVGR